MAGRDGQEHPGAGISAAARATGSQRGRLDRRFRRLLACRGRDGTRPGRDKRRPKGRLMMSISMFDRRALPRLAAIAGLLLGLALAAGGALAQAATDYPDPSERLDWTIAFGPGGGNDIMSRTLIEILDKHDLYPGDIVAENRQGGSGAVGWGYLYNQAGNPYAISSTSGSYITTPAAGRHAVGADRLHADRAARDRRPRAAGERRFRHRQLRGVHRAGQGRPADDRRHRRGQRRLHRADPARGEGRLRVRLRLLQRRGRAQHGAARRMRSMRSSRTPARSWA